MLNFSISIQNLCQKIALDKISIKNLPDENQLSLLKN